MKVAIISFFHTESSLCLAKYLAKQGICVDYYYIANLLHDRKGTSGFEYPMARRLLGNHLLRKDEAPEIYHYMEGLPVRIFLSRVIHHDRYPRLHHYIMKFLMWQIKTKKYDAINIVGQASWINEAHEVFKGENLIHTFHELGNKDGNLIPLEIVKKAISDNSKVILHSQAMYERFMSLPGANPNKTRMIPFGKFETLKLYVNEEDVSLPFSNNNPIFLFYGYIAPYKGLDILAEAMMLLKDVWNQFNLVIAGAGNDPTLSFFSSLSNCILINRYLSNCEMMNLIRQSSVILLPYKSASQTGIIPTCSLYGKPVIATKVGSISENIKDNYNGILIDSNNPLQLAESIKVLIMNSSLRKKLQNGILHYGRGDDFDWSTIAIDTSNFYIQ